MRKIDNNLTKEQMTANERFFESVFRSLNQGGIYCFISVDENFRKEGNKFRPQTLTGYNEIKKIVTTKFLNERFWSSPIFNN